MSKTLKEKEILAIQIYFVIQGIGYDVTLESVLRATMKSHFFAKKSK